MSLAAALSAGGMRPASFIPAIKCSNCGEEIEIAAMGEHICGRAPTSPTAVSVSMNNPFTLRQMNATSQRPTNMPVPLQYTSPPAPPQTRVRAPTIGSSSAPTPKPVRTAPPRINPDAANMPFLAPQLPRSQSPLSPALSSRSGSSNGGKPPMQRSMTSPMPRLFNTRPPSPELTGGYDCAFPPFLPPTTGSGSRPGTSNGRKTPTSDRAPSRGGSRIERDNEQSKTQPLKIPLPLEAKSTGNVMSRMNTLKSGPFEAGRRKMSRDDRTSFTPSYMNGRRPSLPQGLPNRDEQTPRPPTAGSIYSQPDTSKKGPPQRPARPSEDDEIPPTFLDSFSQEPIAEMPSTFSPSQPPVPLRSSDRSRTFPLRQESTDEPGPARSLARMPSEPALRPGRERRPTLTAGPQTAPSYVPQVNPPQRTASRNGTRMDFRMQDAPPVPHPAVASRQEPSHAPSESSSSTGSTSHSYTNSSIGPSPVESAASSIDTFSPLREEPIPYGEDERMRVAALNLKNQQKPGMRAEQRTQRSPPRNFARPRPSDQTPRPTTPTKMPASLAPLMESPMDPAMARRSPSPGAQQPLRPPPAQQEPQPGLLRANTTPVPAPSQAPQTLHMPKQSLDDYDPYRATSPGAGALSFPRSTMPKSPTRPPGPSAPINSRSRSPAPVQQYQPPPPVPQTQQRPQPQRRPTAAVKPKCRGCNQTIEGKSVKAADGRLTGRWHKHCFTCRTCSQPFATADFYVIDNQPYCEQHYHEANGSLCSGCHRGIEGQYLETTSSNAAGSHDRKFHPKCFTCADCRMVLSDDYFEIAGRVFCERHALQNMRGQARMAGPGSNNPGPASGAGYGGLNPVDRKGLMAERRTTKLMMM